MNEYSSPVPDDETAAPGSTSVSSTAAGAAVERDFIGPVVLTEPLLEAWGEHIGRVVEVPVVLALRGQLGAGKSVLARAIARGAGVEGHMPSPTFNLLYRYHAARGIDVVHLDLYRLEEPEEVWELGWAELGDGPEIVLMEWPEQAESLLPPDRWDVRLEIPEEAATVRVVRAERRRALRSREDRGARHCCGRQRRGSRPGARRPARPWLL